MHHSLSISVAILVNALIASAVPTGTVELVPRACVTEYPSLYNSIMEARPNTSYTNNKFDVNYGLPVSGFTKRTDQLVRFDNIPSGSYGCQLEAVFPAGQDIIHLGYTKINVYTVDRDATATDTWQDSPRPVSLFGTLDFDVDPSQPYKRVINSAVCEPSLTYRFSREGSSGVGLVSYEPGQAGPGEPGAGLRIIHNC